MNSLAIPGSSYWGHFLYKNCKVRLFLLSLNLVKKLFTAKKRMETDKNGK
jgi:hypothetical protein